MSPEARARLEGWIGRYENGGSDSEDDWNIAADFREALATIDAQAARVRELEEALTRQTENMAFVLNRVDLHSWHDKFDAELTQDRRALSPPATAGVEEDSDAKKAAKIAAERGLLAMGIEAGYRAHERGWNLQRTFIELLPGSPPNPVLSNGEKP